MYHENAAEEHLLYLTRELYLTFYISCKHTERPIPWISILSISLGSSRIYLKWYTLWPSQFFTNGWSSSGGKLVIQWEPFNELEQTSTCVEVTVLCSGKGHLSETWAAPIWFYSPFFSFSFVYFFFFFYPESFCWWKMMLDYRSFKANKAGMLFYKYGKKFSIILGSRNNKLCMPRLYSILWFHFPIIWISY